MLGKKSIAVVAILFAIMVFFTGRARLTLDDLTAHFRNDFREMLYLPRGRSLKVIACGFDAPLADALFIQAMVYFGESIGDAGKLVVGRAYTYELFDVVTDLSPRFTRAYQVGSVLLTSSSHFKTKLKGCALLDKGVAVFDRLAKENERFIEDPRWLFHSLLATTYDVDIQTRMRREEKWDEVSLARENAAKHFLLAAASPGSPIYIQMAAANYRRYQRGTGDVESSTVAAMTVWLELYEQAKARGDKDILPELEQRLDEIDKYLSAVRGTRAVQEALSEAGRSFLETEGRPPVGVADLVRAGLIPGRPVYPFDDADKNVKDEFIALPDGSFRSWILAVMETRSQTDVLSDAVVRYRRVHLETPPNLQTLVDVGYLDQVWTPPLAQLGQYYQYWPQNGAITVEMPEGPELPPELR